MWHVFEAICLYAIKDNSGGVTFITVDGQGSICSSQASPRTAFSISSPHSEDDPINVRGGGFDSLPTQV